MDINQVIQIKKEKEQNKIKNFEIILKNCMRRISFIVKNRPIDEFIFEVPRLIPGNPIVNAEECAIYLEKELKKKGFQVEFMDPKTILISWKNAKPKKEVLNEENLDIFLRK